MCTYTRSFKDSKKMVQWKKKYFAGKKRVFVKNPYFVFLLDLHKFVQIG